MKKQTFLNFRFFGIFLILFGLGGMFELNLIFGLSKLFSLIIGLMVGLAYCFSHLGYTHFSGIMVYTILDKQVVEIKSGEKHLKQTFQKRFLASLLDFIQNTLIFILVIGFIVSLGGLI